jgi:1-acyl-sn-glycerol-3-phosphate acyltransferase
MRIPLRLFQYVYSIYAFFLFIIIMIIIFPFIAAASAFKMKGGNFIYRMCRIWAGTWYFLIGVRHKEIYESPHDKDKQYVFVANHTSYMDIPSVFLSIRQPMRILGKYEMIRIPVFGWIYKSAVILVDRRSAVKRAKSVKALKIAIKQGISIFIYPEGTFNETNQPLKDFYDGAFRLAIETKTSIKPMLCIDTQERMHYKSIFLLTPGKSRVVFLKEIKVDMYKMADLHQLKQQVYAAMELGLKYYRKYNTNENITSTTNH